MLDIIRERLCETADFMEAALKKRMDSVHEDKMSEAMAYSLLGGGNRIRAFLVTEFW